MTPTRYVYLDSLRGIAAMVVVFVHYFASFLPHAIFGDQTQSTSHIPWLEQLFFYPPFGLLLAGQMAVSLFFILSGYVLSYRFLGNPVSMAETLAMTAKRPIRLGGLVWFSMCLFALFWYMGWFYNQPANAITGSDLWLGKWWLGELNVPLFWQDLLTRSFSQGTVYNNPLWTIGYELYGSFLVFAFLLLFSHIKYRILVLILMVVVFYQSMLVGFWLGMILADLHKHPWQRWRQKFKLPLLLFLSCSFIFLSSYPFYLPAELTNQTIYAWLPDGFDFGLGYPMLAAIFVFIMVLISPRLQKFLSTSIFQYLGYISYAIYVIHAFVIGTFSAWLFLQLHPMMSYFWVLFWVLVTGIFISVILAHIITLAVDKPAIKLAKMLGQKVKTLLKIEGVDKCFKWTEKHLLRHKITERPPEKVNF